MKCPDCKSENVLYYADFIVECHGSITPNGKIDEVIDHDELPIKKKIIGLSCLDCDGEWEV